jgi:hypothetical protein
LSHIVRENSEITANPRRIIHHDPYRILKGISVYDIAEVLEWCDKSSANLAKTSASRMLVSPKTGGISVYLVCSQQVSGVSSLEKHSLLPV